MRVPRYATGLALLALAACGTGTGGTRAERAAGAQEVTVDVFAAASLTEAFTRIGEDVEAANPGVTVSFSFGASSALAQQVLAGAPADVLATASPATLRLVTEAGEASGPQVFARNRLQIAVPPGNPGGVTGLADFADPDRTLALCAPRVPCGAAAEQVLRAAGVVPAPDTLESDVRAALAKVRLGEVDAALVYRTDVLAAGDDVQGIAVPEADGAVNDYPLVVLDAAPDAAAARAFVAHVLSPEGQRVLAGAGFDRP